jgi:hypothetical protein
MIRSYQSIRPDPKYVRMFLDYASFSCEELLAPCPSPKLEDHPLLTVGDWLFKIFAAILHIRSRSFFRNPRTRRAVVTGPHLSDMEKLKDSEDIKRAWENIKENIKISAKDSLGL